MTTTQTAAASDAEIRQAVEDARLALVTATESCEFLLRDMVNSDVTPESFVAVKAWIARAAAAADHAAGLAGR